MKSIFFLLLCSPLFLFGQEQQKNGNKASHFIALYTLGENWDTQKPPNEQTHFKEHSAFLKKLRDEETIAIGARYSEVGMIVFKAEDLNAAKALITSDIAIKNNLFNVEVHTFSPFYKGCIE